MRLIILILGGLCCSINTYAQLHINEMMSLNNTAWATEQNNYPDWIELYNSSSDSILLSDYFLSDDREDLKQWQLPQRYIQGGGFFTVGASGLTQRWTVILRLVVRAKSFASAIRLLVWWIRCPQYNFKKTNLWPVI